MNSDQCLIYRVYSHSTYCPTNSLFSGPGVNPGSHIAFGCHFSLLQSMRVPSPFPISRDIDIFKEYWSIILWSVPQFGYFWCIPMVRLQLCIYDKNTREAIYSLQGITSGGTWCHVFWLVMLILITWLRWCLLGFSPIDYFFLLIIKFLAEIFWDYANILVLP